MWRKESGERRYKTPKVEMEERKQRKGKGRGGARNSVKKDCKGY